MSTPRITLIGGPTVLIEVGGISASPDTTFDDPVNITAARGAQENRGSGAGGSGDRYSRCRALSHDQKRRPISTNDGGIVAKAAGAHHGAGAAQRMAAKRRGGWRPGDTRELSSPTGA